MRLLSMVLFFLIFFTGIATAQTYTVSPTGSNDQDAINQAISQAQTGDTVFLNAGVYDLTGTVIIKSNIELTGDPNAVLRVSASSSQWFQGSTGIISCKESVKNVEICGFQINGNLGAFPASYANSPGHDKDCQRCIILHGDSGDYAENIRIHDMKLYDSFSDGIYIYYAKNSACYNNFISNCQHEGVFWSCVENSEMLENQIAGICSDCTRLDNCVNCKVYDNVLFSYDGNNTNGQYKHGENGLQVGNAGSSHGYDASHKPTTTTNIEIFNNTFANNGLAAIAGSGGENVYIHDNKFIDVSELETLGVSVKGISPTIEQSEKIFSSIFDILDQDFSFQYLNIQVPINASVSVTEYDNTYNPHALVFVDGEGLTSVKYSYNGNSTTHYYSINGKISDIWTGDLQHTRNAVYLNGRFNASNLQVTCFNSQGYCRITDLNVIEIKDNSGQVLNPQLWAFVGTLVILGLYTYRNLRRVTRW
jgi:hypothetical protein